MPIDLYKIYLEREKRVSEHTYSAYVRDLEQFCEFVGGDLEKISLRDVRGWVLSLMDSGFAAKSVHRKVSALRSFYNFLVVSGEVDSSPVDAIVLPKVRKKLPFFVGVKEMDNLFDGELFGTDFVGVRDRAIMSLFYSSGVRLSELIGLRDGDVDLIRCRVKVLGKGDKSRIVPLTSECVESLRSYKERCSDLGVDSSGSFFVRESGEPVYSKLIYRIVRGYLAQVSTIEKRGPHIIRHTFATHLLNGGAGLESIKELLGHASVVTTQVYTHASFEQLKSIYKHAHPRANKNYGG